MAREDKPTSITSSRPWIQGERGGARKRGERGERREGRERGERKERKERKEENREHTRL